MSISSTANVVLTVRVPPEVLHAYRRQAALVGITTSELVRRVLADCMQNNNLEAIAQRLVSVTHYRDAELDRKARLRDAELKRLQQRRAALDEQISALGG